MSTDPIISNPQGPADVHGVPSNLPPFPFDPKSKNEIVQEAHRLHQLATEKTANLQTVRDAAGDAYRALQQAKAELQDLLVKGASTGQIDQEAEMSASVRVSAAERLSDPEVHGLRQRVAQDEQKRAVARYRTFVAQHAVELYEALRPEAEKATAELVKAEESISRQREAFHAAQQRAQQLGSIVSQAAGTDAQAISQLLSFPLGVGSVPVPSEDALAGYQRYINPLEPVVAEEADEPQRVTV